MTFLQGRGEILKLRLRHWTTRAVCCKRLGMRIKKQAFLRSISHEAPTHCVHGNAPIQAATPECSGILKTTLGMIIFADANEPPAIRWFFISSQAVFSRSLLILFMLPESVIVFLVCVLQIGGRMYITSRLSS